MAEPCIMLADIDLIVDISSAYFVHRHGYFLSHAQVKNDSSMTITYLLSYFTRARSVKSLHVDTGYQCNQLYTLYVVLSESCNTITPLVV